MVTWFNSRCEDSPTRAHYFVDAGTVDAGNIFRCLYCHRHRWLPGSFSAAEKFSSMIYAFGEEVAYNKMLSYYPAAKALMTKLEDLWYIRKEVADDETFVEIVKAVMKEREYGEEQYG